MPIEHEDVTSVHRGGHVASSDPGAVGAYQFWTDTTTTPHVLKVRNAANTAWVIVGETITGSNVGAGSEVFKQKSGQVLEFRKIKGNVNIQVEQGANDISLTVVESLLDKPQVQGFYREEFIVSFNGTSDPTVISNPISQYGGATFTRGTLGSYVMTFSGVLPVNGVIVQVTPGTYTGGDKFSFTARQISPTEVVIESFVMDTGVQDDADATYCSISVIIVTTVPFLDTAAGFWGWFHPQSWSGSDSGWFNHVLNPVAIELSRDGTDVGQTGTLNTYDVVQFNVTTNNGRLLSTMAPNTAVIREIFVVMKMREATFSNFAGIITGPDTSIQPPLVGDQGTTKFIDLGYTGQEYRLNNTLYANNDMQAPMNAWGIVHLRYSVGWGFFEVQFGKDRDFAGRFAEVDMAEVLMFSALQPTKTVAQIYEYLETKYNL